MFGSSLHALPNANNALRYFVLIAIYPSLAPVSSIMYFIPRTSTSGCSSINLTLCPKIGSHSAALAIRYPPGICVENLIPVGNPAPPTPTIPASLIFCR